MEFRLFPEYQLLLLPSALADGPKLSRRPALAAFFSGNLRPLHIIEKGQWGQTPTAPKASIDFSIK